MSGINGSRYAGRQINIYPLNSAPEQLLESSSDLKPSSSTKRILPTSVLQYITKPEPQLFHLCSQSRWIMNLLIRHLQLIKLGDSHFCFRHTTAAILDILVPSHLHSLSNLSFDWSGEIVGRNSILTNPADLKDRRIRNSGLINNATRLGQAFRSVVNDNVYSTSV